MGRGDSVSGAARSRAVQSGASSGTGLGTFSTKNNHKGKKSTASSRVNRSASGGSSYQPSHSSLGPAHGDSGNDSDLIKFSPDTAAASEGSQANPASNWGAKSEDSVPNPFRAHKYDHFPTEHNLLGTLLEENTADTGHAASRDSAYMDGIPYDPNFTPGYGHPPPLRLGTPAIPPSLQERQAEWNSMRET